MAILIGAIADDFTGATDLAGTLVNQGMRVTQVIGVPDEHTEVGDAQAVVVALKSRTNPVGEAVDWSLAAARWLNGKGTKQIFFKYCSTFDSTPHGNIGPVSDALLDILKSDFALVCPAFPTNGRSVYKGYLFVGDLLLSDSSMQDHPLTPMRDSSLIRLMSAQSERSAGLIDIGTVRRGAAAVKQRIEELRAGGVGYGVVDAITDEDLETIGEAAAGHALVTGGSAVATGLPENFRRQGILEAPGRPGLPAVEGRSVVMAGSCSQATRQQIAQVTGIWPNRRIDVDAVAAGEDVAGQLTAWAIRQAADKPVLIYASSDPQEVAKIQGRHGVEKAGAMVERVMGRIARGLADNGFNRIVVAGGETSGAIVSALGVRTIRIGPEIDPGVPWTESLGGRHLALALKSGNFGSKDFFVKAFEMLG